MPNHLDAGHAAVSAQNPRRRRQLVQFDAFAHRFLDLVLKSGHFFPGAAVEDSNPTGAEAKRGAGRIHGRVAAADHGHALAQAGFKPRARARRNSSGSVTPCRSSPSMPNAAALLGPSGQIHGAEAQPEEVFDVVHGTFRAQLDAMTQDEVDILLQGALRQAVFGDA